MHYKVPAPSKEKARITGRVLIYHERLEEEPVEVNLTMGDTCECNEEHYTRKITVKEQQETKLNLPFEVDHKLSCLIIKNISGSSYKETPSKEQAEEDSTKICSISFDGGNSWPLMVSPRRFIVVEPANWNDIVFKCLKETTELRIHAIP